MKKLLAISLCAFLLLGCASAHAAGLSFYQRKLYGSLVPYENIPFCYAIDVFASFSMFSDDQLNERWEMYEPDESSDEIYDIRCWLSPDRTYEFQVQVKEQTYASFEEEVKNAPNYISSMEDEMKALGYSNIRQLHNGLIRRTPEGDMLETAYTFTVPNNNGTSVEIIVMYYDCYYENIEYIFEITAYNGAYDTAQALLSEMIKTLDITYPKSK